eukprot:TRINITY_DN2013_c0_g1_i1.p1 TRINITY_DN2013_c0_g1~~TRINITY_DN2013_c0_g1_i1.p1  ORF type:complete len:424 (+),score=155.62 TRINITY_DN2013_c0_g1_i1:131-1273(+)
MSTMGKEKGSLRLRHNVTLFHDKPSNLRRVSTLLVSHMVLVALAVPFAPLVLYYVERKAEEALDAKDAEEAKRIKEAEGTEGTEISQGYTKGDTKGEAKDLLSSSSDAVVPSGVPPAQEASTPSEGPEKVTASGTGEGEKRRKTREEIRREVIKSDGKVLGVMALAVMMLGVAAMGVHRISRRQVFQLRVLRNGKLLEIDVPDVMGRMATHTVGPRSLVAQTEGEVWRLALRPLSVPDGQRQPFRLLRPSTWNWHASKLYGEFRRKTDLQTQGIYQAATPDPSSPQPSVPYFGLSPYFALDVADQAVSDLSLLQPSVHVFDLPQDKLPPHARRFLRKFFSDTPISDSDLLELLSALQLDPSAMVLYTGPSTPFSRAVHRP